MFCTWRLQSPIWLLHLIPSVVGIEFIGAMVVHFLLKGTTIGAKLVHFLLKSTTIGSMVVLFLLNLSFALFCSIFRPNQHMVNGDLLALCGRSHSQVV